MQLLPSWAPNIHPIIVHLPIAALLLAVFFDFLSLIFKRQEWLSKAAVFLFIIGAIGAILAVFSGKEAAEHLTIPKSMYHDVGEHADWGKATAWFFGIYAAFRLILIWWNKHKKQSIKLGAFIISLVGVFLLVETGDHGAKLVFKNGIGTVSLKKEMQKQKLKQETTTAKIPTMQAGGWLWTPGPGSPEMLASDFSWYHGGPKDLNASTIVTEKGDTVLSLNPNNSVVIFGFGNRVSDIQAKVVFKPVNFNGEIGLANRIQDSDNYNVISFNDSTLSINQLVNGNQTTVAQKTVINGDDWITLSVLVKNGNANATINGTEVNAKDLKMMNAGVTGIMIKGNGLLLIRRIDIKNPGNNSNQDMD
ncbi:MAG TPA: DUF2231 domain-containing protein [Balneolales bacterium]|nr:DUF2231 domain-containing protein [Balneolales bacterium]HYX08718.1 DUF2231 domain-containing protein [Bacteroidales bacterium]